MTKRQPDLPSRVILDTRDALERLVWALEPTILTPHDLHQIVSGVSDVLGEHEIARAYENLTHVIDNLNLIDMDERFPTVESRHFLTAGIVEFGCTLLQLVIAHRLLVPAKPYQQGVDPFPYIFTQLMGLDAVFRRVNW